MSSLLSAGIYRYRKSAVFRVMLLTALILGAITGAIADSSSQLNATYLFGMFLAAAIQISLIIGAEFTNGAFRNKLIAGHSKGKVFLSELLLSLTSTTVLFIAHYGAFVLFNLSRFEKLETGEIAQVIFGAWLMHLAFAAICTAVCFFIPYNSAIAAVVNIIPVIVMMFTVSELHLKLNEREYNTVYVADENGNMVAEDEINPEYIPPDSAEYAVIHAVYYLMPCGQLNDYQYALSELWNDREPNEKYLEDLKTAPIYSFAAMTLFSAAAFLCFRKKDLK